MKFSMITALLLCSATVAQEATAQTAASAGSGWTYTIAPYIFMPGISGQIGSFGAPPVDVDISTGDVLNALDFAFSGVFEARHDKLSFGGELFTGTLSVTSPTPQGIVADSVRVKVNMGFGTAYAGYQLAGDGRNHLDMIGGLRYWSVDNKLTLQGAPGGDRSILDGASWVDGIVGIKGRTDISDRVYLTGWALVGSHSEIDLQASLGYQFSDLFSGTLGWRQMSVDYSKDGFVFDTTMSGPMIGLVFNF